MTEPADNGIAIVLTGGGARAAYQVGFLRCLAKIVPEAQFSIITGVSAGAINAVYLANHPGPIEDAAEGLTRLWWDLEAKDVFRTSPRALLGASFRWLVNLVSGGARVAPQPRGFVDTQPLREFLSRALDSDGDGAVSGIQTNIAEDRLKALALTTLNYSTGQTVTWIQGSDLEDWERPYRRSRQTEITIEHLMASAAIPLFFPAVRIDNSWYGDGGVRLTAPLSPALHLGAKRILAISTRYPRTIEEADQPVVEGYPPPAQILGNLANSVFLDLLDQDLERARKINQLLVKLPPEERDGMEMLDIRVLRPSQDLGKLAAEYEPKLPKTFRFMSRGWGTRRTSSPDSISLVMFQPDYLRRLIEIGEQDARAQRDKLAAFFRWM